MSNAWSINLCERPVWRGQWLDKCLLGQPMSHPFLVLLDGAGQVVSELHATWSTPGENEQTVISRRVELASAFTDACLNTNNKLRTVFQRAFREDFPVNRVVVLPHSSQYEERVAEVPVVSGDEAVIWESWQTLIEKGQVQDAAALPYHRYAMKGGVNCQVVLRDVMEAAGLSTDHIHMSLGDSGWGRCVHEG